MLHIANGNRVNCDLLRYFPGKRRTSGFALFLAPNVVFCFMLLMSEVRDLFSTLRRGFIRIRPNGYRGSTTRLHVVTRSKTESSPTTHNILVTWRTDDDVPWIFKYAGGHNLIISTNYGQTGPST